MRRRTTLSPRGFLVAKLIVAAAMLGLIVFYLVNVFAWHRPPTEGLFRLLLVLVMLGISLMRLQTASHPPRNKVMAAFAPQIGGAFENDPESRKKLLTALGKFVSGHYAACRTALDALSESAVTAEVRTVLNLFRALCFENEHHTARAIACYEQALEDTPKHSTVLSNLSVLYTQAEQWDTAIDCAERAVEADPKNALAYNNLASAYVRMLEIPKAVHYAQKAVELSPNLRQALVVLAIAYTILEDEEKAAHYLRAAVREGQEEAALRQAAAVYKERYDQRAHHDATLTQWKSMTSLPAIHFTLNGKEGKSIVGGRINEEAPLARDGRPMRLLAAIFCSELPENSDFPKHGVLRFYIAANDVYGADFEAPTAQTDFRVLFDEDETAFDTVLDGRTHPEFPVLGSFRPRFLPSTDAMPPGDGRCEALYEALRAMDPSLPEDSYDALETIDAEQHKLGGYPFFSQEDPREENTYDTLLFQLVSDFGHEEERVMIGDAGACQFFIPREKLAARDFSDVYYTWDCG